MKERRFQAAWEEFKTQCYPDGMSPVQHQQVRNAFYAGAIVMYALMIKLPDMDEEEGQKYHDAIMDEMTSYEGAARLENQ